MDRHGLQKIFSAIKKINMISATLAGFVLLFITFSIFIDVFLRYFFNRPSIWITEVSTYLFLYIIFMGTAYALQQGMHIRVTFLLDFFGPRIRKVIDMMTSCFALVFSAALLWQSSIMTWTAFEESWTSPTMLNAPYAFIYIIIVFGSLLLTLTFLGHLFLMFHNDQAGDFQQ
jgi:TRAP-type C4-dicarboxylate transport system permease small subunit